MDKIKIKDIADEAGLSTDNLLDKAKQLGLHVKTASSLISMYNAGILVDFAISGTRREIEEEDTSKSNSYTKKENTMRSTNKNNDMPQQNILLNLNQDTYGAYRNGVDIYEKLTTNLHGVIDNKNTDIDEYFEKISDNYSNWGTPFYVSNISLILDKPLILFRPKIKPSLVEYFPENFIIAFTVKPNLRDDEKNYKPFFINDFVKLINSDKREWEQEVELNIYNMENQPRDRQTQYLNKSFVDNLQLISEKTKESLELWHNYIEWKYKAELSTAAFKEINNIDKIKNGYAVDINGKIPKEINDYGIYLFHKENIKIERMTNNNKTVNRLIYNGETNITKYKNYFEYKWKGARYDYFQFENNRFTITTDKDINNVAYIVFIKKDKLFTNTKQYENIKSFQEQGGYAPFLSSYLFDISKARLPKKSNKELVYFNKELTDEQRKAVKVMIDSPDIALIQGPPGTGKTTVIAECIYQYVKAGKKVMLTSESNDAVDNALERLFDEPDIIPLRLTSAHRDDNSKFSKDDALKTYYANLVKPSQKSLNVINDQNIQKERLETHLKQLENLHKIYLTQNKTLEQENNNKKTYQDSIVKLKQEKDILEKGQDSQNNLTQLKEKIYNHKSEFFGIIQEENIKHFKQNIIDKINSTIGYFKWDTDKSNKILSHYINDGLNKYNDKYNVYLKAKEDYAFLLTLDSEDIVTKEVEGKIEELRYDIEVAEEKGDKTLYNQCQSELSKWQRQKGLDIDQYIDILEYYCVDFDKEKIGSELQQIGELVRLNDQEQNLSMKISDTNTQKKEKEKKLSTKKSSIAAMEKNQNEVNDKIEEIKRNIGNLKATQKVNEEKYQDLVSELKSYNIGEYQGIIAKIDIDNIQDTFNNLLEENKSEEWIETFINEQKKLKDVQYALQDLRLNIDTRKNINIEIDNISANKSEIIKLENDIKQNSNRSKINPLRLFFDEEERKNTIDKLSNDISKSEEDIKRLELNSNNQKKDLNSEIDKIIKEIKLIPLRINHGLLEDINDINYNSKIAKVEELIRSDDELKDFINTQNNIKKILKRQIYLVDIVESIINNERSIKKREQDTKDNLNNLYKIEEDLRKTNADIKNLQASIVQFDLKLKQSTENVETVKIDKENYKHIEVNKKETLMNELQRLDELSKWGKDQRREYLVKIVGQTANKDSAVTVLKKFIDKFQKEKEDIDNLLSDYISYIEQYIKNNPIEKFSESRLVEEQNKLINCEKSLNSISNNIKNIDNEFNKIKNQIKKDKNIKLDNDSNLESLLKTIRKRLSQFNFDENSELVENLLSSWVDNTKTHKPTNEEEELYLSNINVAGITLGRSEQALKDINLEYFDVVIVDEISKSTPPEYLRGMMRAKKSILVGDHRQLPPMFGYHGQDLAFEEAMHDEDDNTTLSLENYNKYKRMVTASQFQDYFEKADDRIKYRLTRQFRMHTDIMDIVNCFYDGKLTQGISENKDEHNIQKQHGIEIGNFIEKEKHAYWVDTSTKFNGEKNFQTQDGTSKKNLFEAFLTIEALKKIDEELYNSYNQTDTKQTIGIISFYKGQVTLLQSMIKGVKFKYFDKNDQENFMISTVDSFQGRDRDIILVDLISTKANVGKANFVSSYQRINVAFSRAKNLLVIFGSKDIFDSYKVDMPDESDESKTVKRQVYKDIATKIKRNGCGKSPLDISHENEWKKSTKR